MNQRLDKDPVDELLDFVASDGNRNRNEAETRHKLIDTILHRVLSWPKNRVSVEEYIKPGFADYVLKSSNGDPIFFVEAKREGVFFNLPPATVKGEKHTYLKIERLISDGNIKEAMIQVRDYCRDTGCEYAAITNGHEWVLFKCFERGKKWDQLQALVIRDVFYFKECFTHSVNNLSYQAITENASLFALLTTSAPKDRQIFYPKDRIDSYSHSIRANRLAEVLRPIVKRYFGVIEDGDKEFMNRCYVSERDYTDAVNGMETHIHDNLTPYFAEYGVRQLEDTGKGGQIGGRFRKNVKEDRGGEVLVLFGGKGAGKSTFIKRLLHHKPPAWLKDNAVTAIVDLLKTPSEQELVRDSIWENLVKSLDKENLLHSERDILLAGLFNDKFTVAEKQDLAGLRKDSVEYNIQLNELFRSWLSDHKYCAAKLAEYWNSQGKGIIVVIDNTDQYPGFLQEFCFVTAQEISSELSCVTLISMREERFQQSKIHGTLDAYQNSGFHISSPRPSQVFLKRIQYTIEMLRDPVRRSRITTCKDRKVIEDCCTYLEIVSAGFKYTTSPLNSFLTACGHGDIRLSLSLFRSFLLSGYTNVEEMLSAGSWNFLAHQVVKPVMIPTRYFYDESLSEIPNIFKPRDNRRASHFTALRILRKLSKGAESSSFQFYDVAELKAYFIETFQMGDDLSANLDILLKHSFIEADNRLDEFTSDVDRVRLTNYGKYMYDKLAYFFTYLDLVSLDCGVYDREVSNYLSEAARDEYRLFTRKKRRDRVLLRLDRVEKFLEYLSIEESREIEFYGLSFPKRERFTNKLNRLFKSEKVRIEESSERNSRGREDKRRFNKRKNK